MKLFVKVLPFLMIFFLSGCEDKKEEASLVLFNGNIITITDDSKDFRAVAVKSDTIMFVGTDDDIQSFIGPSTEVIDLEGKTVIPGFIDSHAHLTGLGNSLLTLNLGDAKNWDEIIALVAAESHKLKPGEWIIGRGWHQEKWDPVPVPNIEGYPVHDVLSDAVPFHPVMLTHASGHAVFVNSKAMDIAGITDSTKDPAGGRIVRDENGKAIGVFEETAEELINIRYIEDYSSKTEKEKEEIFKQRIFAAIDKCLENGITTFHDAGQPFDVIDYYKKLADENSLKIRLNVMIGDDFANLKAKLPEYRIIGYGNNHLTVRSVKTYIDGALGSRGAWMLEPYEDLAGYTGLNLTPLPEIKRTAEIALLNGFQLCTHAIGDRGNREILNIYERVISSDTTKSDKRWRVEHAQHLSKNDIGRFAQLGVVASMQGVHCTSDATFVIKRLGYKRAEEGAYVWRKLIDSGAVICNGTDSPVEDISPIQCYYSTVTRKLNDGSVFFPDQKMSRLEALKSYTINGAYAAFEENIKGSIEKGKLADLTVLSQNLLTAEDEILKNTEVLMTIVAGKILFKK
ncbi:MAG: amidohydrolase [Melioribacteraceae bacterium]|nr:amidohydrolase [Melioribacteraceae bacterium]